MTVHLSARRRVELALIPNLLFQVTARALDGAAVQDREVLDHLRMACREPLDGLAPAEQAALARRITRTTEALLAEFRERGRTCAVVYMAVIHFLRSLLEDGTLVLIEGSPADQAITAILDAVNGHPDLVDVMDRSARKAAARMGVVARRLGYFSDTAARAA